MSASGPFPGWFDGLAARLRPIARLAAAIVLAAWSLASLGQTAPAPGQPAAVPAHRQARNVAVITLRGEITDVTAQSVKRRITIAERAGAHALVFELDTPGGEIGAVLAISSMIKASPIANTVAWINRDAYSGGAIIAMACREIVTSDPAAMGDAIPIGITFGFLQQMDAETRQKILSGLIADLVASARLHGRDEKLMQGLVALGVELWLVENIQTGRRLFIDRAEYQVLFGPPPAGQPTRLASAPLAGQSAAPPPPASTAPPAPDAATPGPQPELLPAPQATPGPPVPEELRFRPAAPALADPRLTESVSQQQLLPAARPVFSEADRGQWREIEKVSDGVSAFVFSGQDLLHYNLAEQAVRNDRELMAFFGARHLLRLDQNWSETLVAFLTNLYVKGILVVLLLVGVFLEMTNPGMVFPGAVASVALVALLGPPLLIDMANWWQVGAILAGIALIAVEIFVIPGFGIFGIIGLLALFAGLVGVFVPQGGMFPDTPGARNDMLYGVATLTLAIVTSFVTIYFLSKHLGSLPLFGRLVLKDPDFDDGARDGMLAAMQAPGPMRPGSIGVAITPLRPAGRIQLGDDVIDVVCETGFAPPGTPVRIIAVSPFRISVEPADQPPPVSGRTA